MNKNIKTAPIIGGLIVAILIIFSGLLDWHGYGGAV